jgi:hypothetical protein
VITTALNEILDIENKEKFCTIDLPSHVLFPLIVVNHVSLDGARIGSSGMAR